MTSDSATSEGPRPAGKAPGQESLAPQRTRIMGRLSYLLAWFGGCVSIGTFAMGSSIVGTLNLLQASLAIAIGCFVIGVALTINGAAGVADPIDVFANAVDNPPLLITTLLFIAFAQVTTNVLNNVVPPTYVLMDVFKLKFRSATVIVGLLAFATFPWELVKDDSAAGLQLFVQTYSAFLGPIFAIMAVDYYLIRRRTLDLDKLYDAHGPYRGINYAACIATLIGALVALNVSAVSWYASLLPAGLAYYLLMRYWPACRRFNQ
ncbi:cytosine permease [Chromohalobacter japonicus]|uniref:cytosine permease n=1 Tax=Chromohalobacter japonicus TaxID=223900 RepID=UPI001FF4F03D|nr:cytosine permease [Chromohalobacter japonicus]MCK0752849.1 cytosine permease [Chromohalobacter japonicus]